MPGVKKLFQESENCSKPAYIFGHMYGGVAAAICREEQYFALPLDLNIQDGMTLSQDTFLTIKITAISNKAVTFVLIFIYQPYTPHIDSNRQ